jgi:HEAT repeat protein
MHKHIARPALLLALFATVACDDRADTTDDRAGTVPATDAVSTKLATAPTDRAAVLASVREQVAVLAAKHPAEVDALRSATPTPSRAGFLLLRHPAMDAIAGAPVIAERLLDTKLDPQVRVALAEALEHTQGPFEDVALLLASEDEDTDVRVALVQSLRRGDEASVRAALELAFADPDPELNGAAVYLASRRAEIGRDFTGELLDVAGREDHTELAAAAVRTVGILGAPAQFDAILPHLDDADAAMRLAAVRALARLDPERAANLTQLAALTKDPDDRVSRAAAKAQRREFAMQR